MIVIERNENDRRFRPLLEEGLQSMGYHISHIEFGGGRRSVLRVFIDTPKGVTIEDCERASRYISSRLDVEDPIKEAYHLEVSSPGLDRYLFVLDDFHRYKGYDILVKLTASHNGRVRFQGAIGEVNPQSLTLHTADGVEVLAFSQIRSAKLLLTDALLHHEETHQEN